MRQRRAGTRCGARASALWGRGGRNRLILIGAAIIALAAPATATAEAFVPGDLLQAAATNPDGYLHVIVLAEPGVESGDLKSSVMKDSNGNQYFQLRAEFEHVVDGVAITIRGRHLLELARKAGVESITPDAGILARDLATPLNPVEAWPYAIGAPKLTSVFTPSARRVPAIAIIDSGVDPDRKNDFGGRIADSVNFSTLGSENRKDDHGHGTMVAAIAAGSSSVYPGVAPGAPIVSLRVLDGNGRGITSDVLKALDWVHKNRSSKNIRVVNLSLSSPYASWGLRDPLNAAVRNLWLSGTVVVTSAGNAGPGRMLNAPASDPFVITVGAVDVQATPETDDDTCAPWSSYGYTAEGFAKPELGAPGRYMVVPAVGTSTLASLFASRLGAPGYMWMSGTSFAAPVVAGAAAQLLALKPTLTPDQVKGALMLSARQLPAVASLCAGVGELDLAAAAEIVAPPNPNENLYEFVRSGGTRQVFDVGRWEATVQADANWTSANWTSANWTSANWTSSNWTSSQWSAANWTSSNWTSANWTLANWTASNWTSSNWTNSNWTTSNWTTSSWVE
jgi:serine protease AprX